MSKKTNRETYSQPRFHITAEAITRVLRFIEEGLTDKMACIRAGVGPGTFKSYKHRDKDLRLRVDAARAIYGEQEYQKIMIERLERKNIRQSVKKARPAKVTASRLSMLVFWWLSSQIPLNQVFISEDLVRVACDRYGLKYPKWQLENDRFDLMNKVYKKRAAMRGAAAPVDPHAHKAASAPQHINPVHQIKSPAVVRQHINPSNDSSPPATTAAMMMIFPVGTISE